MTAHRNKPKADIDFVLRKTFKKDSFRSVQREVIEVSRFTSGDAPRELKPALILAPKATLAGFDVYIQASTGGHDGPPQHDMSPYET